jgi:hypothetical protein
MLVMTHTFPRNQVRPSWILEAIIEIARRSDQIEGQLNMLDPYSVVRPGSDCGGQAASLE